MTTRPGYVWDATASEWVEIGQAAVVSPFKYQATAPSSPATGDIWIESDVDVPSIDSAQFLRWRKTMSGGETSLSGNDDNGLPLQYTPGYEQLYINGVLQVRGGDYTATTGTTVTGLTALVVNDVVEIFSAIARTVADVYTQTQSDTKYYSKTSSASTGEASTVNINTKPWNMPWGTVSYERNIGAALNLTTTTETGFMGGPAFTPVAGRLYEITVTVGYFQKLTNVGNGYIRLRANNISGTIIDEVIYSGQGANTIWPHCKTFLATSAQLGTSSFVPFVTAQTNTNGLLVQNVPTYPGGIIVKDIGPA
jgi:hypothetical protein